MAVLRSVLPAHYSGLIARPNRLVATVLAGSILTGCSVSVPGLGGDEGPPTTGSIAGPVEVERPLPETLAYSDATKIGQAAFVALWAPDAGSAAEWLNDATGSSGTVEAGAAEAGQDARSCRPFSTVVTSLGGVHRYAGKVCRDGDGRSVVQIADGDGTESS